MDGPWRSWNFYWLVWTASVLALSLTTGYLLKGIWESKVCFLRGGEICTASVVGRGEEDISALTTSMPDQRFQGPWAEVLRRKGGHTM